MPRHEEGISSEYEQTSNAGTSQEENSVTGAAASLGGAPEPMYAVCNIHFDLSTRTRGLAAGGIGVMHHVALRSGLVAAMSVITS